MIRFFGLAGLLLAVTLGLIACSVAPGASGGAQPGADIGSTPMSLQPSRLGTGGGSAGGGGAGGGGGGY